MLRDIRLKENNHAAKVNALQSSIHHVTDSVDKLTCHVRLAHKFETVALVDTGANISILKETIFRSLPAQFRRLQKSTVRVVSATGDALNVIGKAEIPLKIGTQNIKQEFTVVGNLKQSCILGLDFLRKHKINLNLARNIMAFNHEDIPLTGLHAILAKARINQSYSIKPNSMSFVYVRPKSNYIDHDVCYQISTAESPLFKKEPGFYILNSISKVHANGLMPCMIINDTGKHFHLTKGTYIANTIPSHTSQYEINEVTTSSVPDKINLKKDWDPKYSVQNLKIENTEITTHQRERLVKLIQSYSDIFATHAYDIGKANIEVSIPLKDKTYTKPLAARPFRVPLSLQKEVQDQISKLLKYDIVKPSHSPWAFPLVTVKKPDNSTRVCIDFRRLNLLTENFSFPMANFDTVLGNLANAKVFSTFDLNQAYLQIPVCKKDQHLLSFVCDSGKYEYQRLPFGLSLSPALFNEFMIQTLQPHSAYSTSWLDDVLCFSPDVESHFRHLKALFQCMRENNLKLKLPKCTFFKLKLRFVGYIISASGVSADPEKITAIKAMKPPTSITETRSFIGCLNFYRRLMPNFAQIARPLTELTHKNAVFKWNTERQKAFDTLKSQLMSEDVLAFPDASKTFDLYCDSSDDCIGSCLTQNDSEGIPRPIYFISHQLDRAKRRWCISEKEAYSIIYSLNKLRSIIYGSRLNIYTDHRPLLALQSGSLNNAKLQRWALILADYNAKIIYLPGTRNSTADYFSRYVSNKSKDCNLINSDLLPPPERRKSLATSSESAVSSDDDTPDLENITCTNLVDIVKLQSKDPAINKILYILENSPNNERVSRYTLIDDVLHYLDDSGRTRLVLPKAILPQIIKDAHENLLSCHLGAKKTYETIKQSYFCKGMWAAVHKFVQTCPACVSANTRGQRIPIQEIEVPKFPFETIAIDICGPFPTSAEGNKYVITVIDLLTKFVEAKPSPDKSAKSVASFLIDDIIPRHSCPRNLISDNGGEFNCDLMSYITDTLKIHHIRTSAYNPQANATLERSHRLLADTLVKLSREAPENWCKFVKNYVGSHNCSVNYTGFSPFYTLYGRPPVFPMETLLRPRDKYYGEEFGPHLIEKMHKTFKIVRKQIKKESLQNRVRYNKTTSFDILGVGDIVYVKNTSRQNKLDSRWNPVPFIIIEKTGHHSFKIQNRINGRVYRYHQRNLRKAEPNEEWLRPIPKDNEASNRPRRRARNAASDSDSDHNDSPSSDSDNDNTPDPIINNPTRETRRNDRDNVSPSHPDLADQHTWPPDPIFMPSPPVNPTPLIDPQAPSVTTNTGRPDPIHWPSQKRTIEDVASSDENMDTDSPSFDSKKSKLSLVTSLLSSLDSLSKKNDISNETLNALLLSTVQS